MTTAVDSLAERDRGARRGRPAPQAVLVRLLDASEPLLPSSRHALRGLAAVELGRGPLGSERRPGPDGELLVLREPNARVSSAHARLRPVLGTWIVEDLGARNGTFVNGERVASSALRDGDVLEVGRTAFLFRDGVGLTPEEPLDLVAADAEITLHPGLGRALGELDAIAPSTVSVVVHGETGTGKEVVARRLHARSGRRGPFVAVNCGALPEALVESELFGVRRGAFSDAREDRPGLVRSAHGGTLFLDELGDLPRAQQAAFLRVLQEREVLPVGQAQPVVVDVRVVVASLEGLDALVAAGLLREDLAMRLAGFTLRLPPLRERREDLGVLVAALVRRLAPAPGRVSFHPDAVRAMLRHRWPGNVRELEKRLGAALVLAGDSPIVPEQLGELGAAAAPPPPAAPLDEEGLARRAELERLLAEHGGNLTAVAKVMGKDRVQIRRWLKRFGLDPSGFRGD